MCIKNRVVWKVTVNELPKIKRSCKKCGKATNFVNTKKFRVNANKRKLDVWMIFQCEHCKSTWNMTIYERTNRDQFTEEVLESYTKNEQEYIRACSFEGNHYKKNGVTLLLEDLEVEASIESENIVIPGRTHYSIYSDVPLDISVDKMIALCFKKSRSQVKKWIKNEWLDLDEGINIKKAKLNREISFIGESDLML